MIVLASIIERFESDFLNQYGAAILPSHRQALGAMKGCRANTLALRMLARCDACGAQRLVPQSCGHRSCPHCQHHESQQWIERQLQGQVAAPYFLITFTLPQQLRDLAWHHQRTLYGLLVQCAWHTLDTFCHNDRQLQGRAGAVAVLHTHSRRLEYHPHVHLAMPAGALDGDKRLWRVKQSRTKGTHYLFKHTALAKVFRAKLLQAIAGAGLALPCDLPEVPEKWVVDCRHVGTGEKALVYLGRYLYRGVIQEKDIVRCDNGLVSFRYRDAKTGKPAVRTVSGATFLWLVMQHVLPRGFRRARNFGFLHPNSKRLIALLQVVLKIVPTTITAWVKPRAALRCPCCGEPMRIVRTRIEPPSPGRWWLDADLAGVSML